MFANSDWIVSTVSIIKVSMMERGPPHFEVLTRGLDPARCHDAIDRQRRRDTRGSFPDHETLTSPALPSTHSTALVTTVMLPGELLGLAGIEYKVRETPNLDPRNPCPPRAQGLQIPSQTSQIRREFEPNKPNGGPDLTCLAYEKPFLSRYCAEWGLKKEHLTSGKKLYLLWS